MFGEPYERLNLVYPPDVDADSANKFVGTFQFKDFYRPNGTVTITLRKNRLFADGGPLLPIDEGLGEPTKFIHRRYWSTLEFVGDKDGNTVELNFDQFKGRKIK